MEVKFEPLYHEKVVERVLLLPQILEVIKNVHHISEEVFLEGLHAVIGVNVQIHTLEYIKICEGLRADLLAIIATLTGAHQKIYVEKIQIVVALLTKLIQFPTIIQVPKEVPKIITIPIDNKVSTEITMATFMLIEKLVLELKRIMSLNINLHLDIDITNIFFGGSFGFSNMFELLKKYSKTKTTKTEITEKW